MAGECNNIAIFGRVCVLSENGRQDLCLIVWVEVSHHWLLSQSLFQPVEGFFLFGGSFPLDGFIASAFSVSFLRVAQGLTQPLDALV